MRKTFKNKNQRKNLKRYTEPIPTIEDDQYEPYQF